MARYDILVFGDYFLDLIFTGLPQFPALGKEVFATGFDMLPGGAYTVAAAMHRLGLRVGWAADFGDDEFSRFALAQAAAEGLDEALFVRHRGPLRRITVSASYPLDRAFLTYADPDPVVPAAMRALATTGARAAYIAGIYHGKLFDAGLLLARSKGMKLVMDGNSDENAVLRVASVLKAVSSADLWLSGQLREYWRNGKRFGKIGASQIARCANGRLSNAGRTARLAPCQRVGLPAHWARADRSADSFQPGCGRVPRLPATQHAGA